MNSYIEKQNKKQVSEKDACCLFVDLTLGAISRFWQEGMAADIEEMFEFPQTIWHAEKSHREMN